MIDNLLDVTTLDRDVLSLQYSLVNLTQMLNDNQGFFQHEAENKNIQLTFSLPKEDVCVFADGQRILQVITNLVNNAIKFTPENQNITVEVKLIGLNKKPFSKEEQRVKKTINSFNYGYSFHFAVKFSNHKCG